MDNTNITPISLGIRKKSFAIDGDEGRVIYLDPSDMGILSRLETFGNQIEPTLSKLKDVSTEQLGSVIAEVDKELRDEINAVFDYDVCSVCVPSGTMVDVIEGKFKFEIVVNALADVYTNTISDEMKKVTARMAEHTEKYTGIKRV